MPRIDANFYANLSRRLPRERVPTRALSAPSRIVEGTLAHRGIPGLVKSDFLGAACPMSSNPRRPGTPGHFGIRTIEAGKDRLVGRWMPRSGDQYMLVHFR